jgi:hypothetical protein
MSRHEPGDTARIGLLRPVDSGELAAPDTPLAAASVHPPEAGAGGAADRMGRAGTGKAEHRPLAPQDDEPPARLVLAKSRPRPSTEQRVSGTTMIDFQSNEATGYVYEQMYEHLAGRIASGDLAPNTPLPAERRLAQEYRVSLGTARHATGCCATATWSRPSAPKGLISPNARHLPSSHRKAAICRERRRDQLRTSTLTQRKDDDAFAINESRGFPRSTTRSWSSSTLTFPSQRRFGV